VQTLTSQKYCMCLLQTQFAAFGICNILALCWNTRKQEKKKNNQLQNICLNTGNCLTCSILAGIVKSLRFLHLMRRMFMHTDQLTSAIHTAYHNWTEKSLKQEKTRGRHQMGSPVFILLCIVVEQKAIQCKLYFVCN